MLIVVVVDVAAWPGKKTQPPLLLVAADAEELLPLKYLFLSHSHPPPYCVSASVGHTRSLSLSLSLSMTRKLYLPLALFRRISLSKTQTKIQKVNWMYLSGREFIFF